MSLGALTSTFTPPSSCISSFANVYLMNPPILGTEYHAGGPVSTDGCFPSNYGDARTDYYSPGICPAGYMSACTSLNAAGAVTEIVVTCCPTSFSCNHQTSFTWETIIGCSSPFNTISTVMTVISNGVTANPSTTTSTWGVGALNAYSVQVRFQLTDFQSTTFTPISTGTSTSTSSTSKPAASNNGGGELSPGAAAGIGVGATLGLLALVGLAIIVGRRSARLRNGTNNEYPVLPIGYRAELAAENKQPAELGPTWTQRVVSEPLHVQIRDSPGELDSGVHMPVS